MIYTLFFTLYTLPQNKAQAANNIEANIKIREEKKLLLRKIKEIEQVLSKINKQKTASLGKLDAIKLQIESNKKLIALTGRQISSLNKNLKSKEKTINTLENKLNILRKDYAKMIYQGMKTMNMLNKILFIFSSKSFNEMFQKIKYINQYAESRRKYLKRIKETSNNLKIQRSITENKKRKVKQLLIENNKEKAQLSKIKKIQIQTISVLNKEGEKLKKDLKQQNKAIEQIQRLLNETIEEDDDIDLDDFEDKETKPSTRLKPKMRPAKAPTPPKTIPKSKIKARPIKNLKGPFFKNRGKIPWPVKEGFISKRFGIRAHPILKKVKVENHGIDIQTQKEAKAFAVFEGVVKVVAFVPGMQQVVIVKHGHYHTVYARLKSTCIKVGDILKALDPIGTIYTNLNDGITELQFQIRKGASTITLNPANWLVRK